MVIESFKKSVSGIRSHWAQESTAFTYCGQKRAQGEELVLGTQRPWKQGTHHLQTYYIFISLFIIISPAKKMKLQENRFHCYILVPRTD